MEGVNAASHARASKSDADIYNEYNLKKSKETFLLYKVKNTKRAISFNFHYIAIIERNKYSCET